MKYYRVKPEHDNKRKPGEKYDIYVANELYTEKETEKQHINKNFCELVEIPKTQVYFFFGCRFADAATIKAMQEKQQLINAGAKQQAQLAFCND